MCKQETTANETTSGTSPDKVAESQPEEDKDCVEDASSAEVEETDKGQLNLFPSDGVDETDPETDSHGKNGLPEAENLTASDDEHAQPEQNTLEEMNKTLSDVWQLLNQSVVVQSEAQTEIFQSTQDLSTTTLAELKELFETQISRNVNQSTMFKKMYLEMKGYKENFLLEALHKPVIHNLIQFYDDFIGLESQFKDILNKDDVAGSEGLSQDLQRFKTNLEDISFELEEVLYRMDVLPYEEEQQEMFGKKLRKTIQVIPTDDPDKDQKVAEVRKKGFFWRDKVFRPEEVTVYRYEPPEVKPQDETDEHTTNEEGDEIDE